MRIIGRNSRHEEGKIDEDGEGYSAICKHNKRSKRNSAVVLRLPIRDEVAQQLIRRKAERIG